MQPWKWRQSRGYGTTYGLGDRHGVSVFLEMMLAFTPDFDRAEQNAWARDVLDDVRCPGWFKRERLLEQARSRGPAGSTFGISTSC